MQMGSSNYLLVVYLPLWTTWNVDECDSAVTASLYGTPLICLVLSVRYVFRVTI